MVDLRVTRVNILRYLLNALDIVQDAEERQIQVALEIEREVIKQRIRDIENELKTVSDP